MNRCSHVPAFVSLEEILAIQKAGGYKNALSILRRQTNRSAQDRLSRPQLLSPPAMPLLRIPLQHHRRRATCGTCEVESCRVDFRQITIRRHVDHIVSARLIRRLKAGNPDRRENLQCICASCHGHKRQADHKLCLGDKLGYIEILRTHNFDLVRAEHALALYGL